MKVYQKTLGKRVTSLFLVLVMMLTLLPNNMTMVYAGTESETSGIDLKVNGSSIKVEGKELKDWQSFPYGTDLTYAITGVEAESPIWSQVSVEDVNRDNLALTEFKKMGENPVKMPGSYYIVCDYGDSSVGTELTHGFTIVKSTIALPQNLAWDGKKATWTAPSLTTSGLALDADTTLTYKVVLKKDDTVIVTKDSVTETSVDFSSEIDTNSYGDYVFTVQAIVGTGSDRYDNSGVSTVETAYELRDTTPPVIASFALAGQESEETKGRLTGKASDNVGITHYAFSKDGAAPADDSSLWKAYTGEQTANEAITCTSDVLTESGDYVFYVKDAQGNVASSENAISATKVTYGDQSALLFEGESLTIPDGKQAGYDFVAWYTNNEYTGEKVEKVSVAAKGTESTINAGVATIPVGGDYPLYAKYNQQTYSLALAADKASADYAGTGSGAGITLTATLNTVDKDNIDYVWYKVDGNEETEVHRTSAATAYTDTYTVYNVADSGTYKVKATVHLGASSFAAESTTTTITINSKALTLAVKDIADVPYGSPVPTEFGVKAEAEGLVDGETVAGLIDSDALTLGTFATTYDPSSESRKGIGTYDITLTGSTADNYTVTATKGTLTVVVKDVNADGSGVTIEFENPDFSTTYTGSAIEPVIVVKDGETAIDAANYTVSYLNSINVGTATVQVTFQNNYTGTLTLNYDITQAAYTTSVVMKDKNSQAYTSENATWMYGDTEGELTPYVSHNPTSPSKPVFYYAKQSEGNTLNRESATTTKPVDAGEYYVWAVIPADNNYKEVVSEAFAFTITKRQITITAASQSWAYDGKFHSNDRYEMTGNGFAGSDGFKSVTVSGSITNQGSVDNVITYELTPSTKEGNYDITAINGNLTVTKITLTTPSDFAWDSAQPGVLTWTPVSQKDLTVEYEVKVYRGESTEALINETVQTDSLDVLERLRTDMQTQETGQAYRATIRVVPKSGAVVENYQASNTANAPKPLRGVKVNVTHADNVSHVYTGTDSTESFEEVETLYLFQGESVTLKAKAEKGYENGKWSVIGDSSLLTLEHGFSWWTNTITVCEDFETGTEVTVSVNADDKKPVILEYKASNDSPAYKKINFSIKAQDALGPVQYALINAESEAKITEGDISWSEMTVEDAEKGIYTATPSMTQAGKFYLLLKDSTEQIIYCGDSAAITVYSIEYSNGKTTEESGLYNDAVMHDQFKLANTSITLASCVYEKTGYTFRNWQGKSGILYNDGATYAANASDTLTAQWSGDQYPYTVNYYYMNADGTYPTLGAEEADTVTKSYTGNYNATISITTPTIQLTRVGFELDTTHTNSITLTDKSQTPELNVYYKRSEYTITYRYVDPATSETETLTDEEVESLGARTSYRYGDTYVIPQGKAITGYTFVGWNFGDFDTSQTTMPAKNLEALGTYKSDAVEAHNCYYFQNLPNTTGSIQGGDYQETASSNYTLDASVGTVIQGTQGQEATQTKSGAKKFDGYEIVGVYVSTGATSGTTKPEGDGETATGTFDAGEGCQLYFNYYYKRIQSKIDLNVYIDERDKDDNLIYTKQWTYSYGVPFDQADTNYMASFGYSETDKENAWINGTSQSEHRVDFVNDDGTRKDEYKSYILADYTDWSCGVAPTTMPSGDVTITKEYVPKTSAAYQVQLYFQTVDKNTNEVVYPDTPTHTVYYYDTIGKNITIGGNDDDTTLNYNTIGGMLEANFSAYQYDGSQEGEIKECVLQDAEPTDDVNVLRLYFKRNEVESTVTYYYRDGENSQKVITRYKVKQEWGTKYTINPMAYYDGTATGPVVSTPEEAKGDGYNYVSEVTTPLGESINYNDLNCVISYTGHQYTASKGYSWQPDKNWVTAGDIVSTEPVEMGQSNNYIDIYYSKIDVDNTYTMKLGFNTNSTHFSIKVGEGGVSATTSEGAVADGTTYNLYIANEKDLFDCASSGGYASQDNYKVLGVLGKTYTRGDLKSDYTPVTITIADATDGGAANRRDTYYLKNDTNDLYIVNKLNNFFQGNRVYFDVNNDNQAQNGARVGLAEANKLVEEKNYRCLQTSYRPEKYEDGALYYYYQEPIADKNVTFVMGNKTATKAYPYGSSVTPSTDEFVAATFQADEGYRIVWYEDSAYQKPVDDKSYEVKTDDMKFYGRRERALIDNKNYLSYALSEPLKQVVKDANESFDTSGERCYIDESNYTSFNWVAEAEKQEGDHFVKKTETLTKTYVTEYHIDNDESKDYITRNYTATRESYYIDGELVMIREDNKTLSYNAVSLDYQSTDYAIQGFVYEDTNVNNKINGYCQKSPISLNAYFYRDTYNLYMVVPDLSGQGVIKLWSRNTYGDAIDLQKYTKSGYELAGWTFFWSYDDNNQTGKNELTEAEVSALHYMWNENDETASFTMANHDLYVVTEWTPTDAQYDILTYFQTDRQTYDRDGLAAMIAAEAAGSTESPVNITINGTVKSGYVITTGEQENEQDSTILGVAFKEGDVTFYCKNPKTVEGGYSVEATDIIGAKQTETIKTGDSKNVSDYKVDVSAYDIYSYAFTNYQTGDANEVLNDTQTFTAVPGMTLCYYFTRTSNYAVSIDALSVSSTAEQKADSGVTISGDGTGFYYGEEATLVATVKKGFTFKGWYLDSQLNPTEKTSDEGNYLYIDSNVLESETAFPYEVKDNGDGTTTYTSTPAVTGDTRYIAVTEPQSFESVNVVVEISAGREDYTYGYKEDTGNTLTAKVTVPAEYHDLVSVVGYQWHLVNAENGAVTTDTELDSKYGVSTGSTLILPTGLPAGTYYFQCEVKLKRTDNNSIGYKHADTAKKIVIKKIGEGDDPNKIKRYYYSTDEVATYDGQPHTIGLQLYEENGLIPQNYNVYFSESPLESFEAVTSGLNAGTVVESESHTVGSSFTQSIIVPNEFAYTDVKYDESGEVATRTVYFYIRTEDELLDPNFSDQYGHATVTINPQMLTIQRANPFTKVYDGKAEVEDSDLERLLNGDGDTKYFTINNEILNGETGWKVSAKAAYNSWHVDEANAVTLSDLKIIYTTGEMVGQENTNFRFANGYAPSISAYITPFPLELTWEETTSFVYDGMEHAVKATLTGNTTAAPDHDLELVSLGAQVNTGTYYATASLKTEGKHYNVSDYSFNIEKQQYTITACPVTISPKDEIKTYNGKNQTLTTFALTRGDVTNDVADNGTCDNLPAGQSIRMDKLETDKKVRDVNGAGDTITTKVSSVKIYDDQGKDVTYNYDITAGTGTLKIEPMTVTVDGITAEDKEYDGTTDATLVTEEKTLKDGAKVTVLKGAVIAGQVAGDEVYVKSSAATDVHFAGSAVKENETVTFTLSADAFVGADSGNYSLNVEGSQKETQANITRYVITVKVNDLSTGTVYGETPAYGVTYTGWKNGDTESVITGTPTYLLDGVNYETSEHQYSYTNGTTTIAGTKIPYKESGYTITLDVDENGYVKGLSADNYVFKPDTESTAKLKITKRPVAVNGIDRNPVISKTYDSDKSVDTTLEKDTDYEFVAATEIGEGLLPNDTIDLSYEAAYNSANVSEANTIQVTNLALTSDNQGGNYALSNTSFDIEGKITPAPLTVTADAMSTTYGSNELTNVSGEVASDYTATAVGYVGSDSDSNTKTLVNGSGITLSCEYNTSDPDKRNAGEYTITPSALTDTNYEMTPVNGTLTVNKKEIIVGVQDKSIIYGKQDVPANESFVATYTGWEYEESEIAVLGDKTQNVTFSLETSEDGYPYKEDGYTITVNGTDTLNNDPSIINYRFTPKNGTFTVNRQYISVSGITVKSKVYDGTVKADISYNPDKITFTCYVNKAANQTYYIKDFFNSTLTSEQLVEKLKENLDITGTYVGDNAKDVGTNKEVAISVSLKSGSYLDKRYALIPSDATELENYSEIVGIQPTQSVATGDITKRPVTIGVFYEDATTGKLLYGEEVDSTKFSYRDETKGQEGKGFVDGEDIKDLNCTNMEYKIVDAPGNPYTPTSGAGTYYVKQEGLSDVGTNYDLTVRGSSVIAELISITVDPKPLDTPKPKWSSTNPGTITWEKVADVGNVHTASYKIVLYRDGSLVSGSEQSVGEDDSSYDSISNTYSYDYASLIRSCGPGEYTVKVRAIATVDATNNPNNKNVLDSEVATSDEEYAANVSVAFATDSVTAKGATTAKSDAEVSDNRSKASGIAIDTDDAIGNSSNTSRVMINGESARIKAVWYDEEGYQTGYTTKITKPDTITLDSIADQTTAGTYEATVTVALDSASDNNIFLALVKRAATLSVALDEIKDTAIYNYTEAEAPHFKVTASPESGDNVLTADYKYTYKWEYRRTGSFESLTDKDGKNDVADLTVTTGLAVYETGYTVKYTVTATRKDNGATKTEVGSTTMYIQRATIEPDTIKVTVDDWTYGEERKTPTLSMVDAGKAVPSEVQNAVTYYYTTDNTQSRENWIKWDDTNTPKDAGTYYVYAKTAQTENYNAVETADYTTLTISANKLGKKAISSEPNTPENLAQSDLIMEGSTIAPYGIAKWPVVEEPKENGDSTTSYITAGYQVSLYRKELNATGEAQGTLVKQYENDVVIDKTAGYCTLDMTEDMNKQGTYYYVVKAISGNQTNCENSDEVTSVEFTVFDTIQVTVPGENDQPQSILNEATNKAEHTYDGRDITLSVATGTTNATYQWYKDGQPMDGKTDSFITCRYVEESGTYSCKITVGANTFESTHVELTVKPRTITIVSASADKTYDGSALTKDLWWIKEDVTEGTAAATAGSAGSVTEQTTGNAVSGVAVEGTKTEVSYKEDASEDSAGNTIALTAVNIVEKVTGKKLYGDTVTSPNYIVEKEEGTLTIRPRSLAKLKEDGTPETDTEGKTVYNEQIAVADVADVTYTGMAKTPEPVVTDSIIANEYKRTLTKDTDYTLSYVDNTDAGTATITITGMGNYKESITKTFKIIAAGDTVTISNDISKMYDGMVVTDPEVSRNSLNQGSVSYQYYTKIGEDTYQEVDAPYEVGTYYVKALVEATGNFKASESDYHEFSITVRPIRIKAVSDTKVYDRQALTNSGYEVVSAEGYKDIASTDEIASVVVTGSQTVVGESANVPSNAKMVRMGTEKNVTSNYSITYEDGTGETTAGKLKVTPTDLNTDEITRVKVTPYEGIYDAQSHGIQVEIEDPDTNGSHTIYYGEEELTAENYTTEGNTTNPEYTDVGEHTVYYYIVSDNYKPVAGSSTVKITANSQTIEAEDVTATYDGAAHGVTASVTLGDGTLSITYEKVEGETKTAIEGKPVHAGTYEATIKAAGTANYDETIITKTVVIQPREIALTSDSDEKIYDGTPLTKASVILTDGSLVQDESHTDTIKEDMITYTGTITHVAYDADGNITTVENTFTLPETGLIVNEQGEDVTTDYAIISQYGTLKVTPKSLDSITVSPVHITYTGQKVGPEDIKVYADLGGTSTKLVKGQDYEIRENTVAGEVSSAVRAGSYTVVATGKGNFTGTVRADYFIEETDAPVITGVENNESYCGDVTFEVTDANLSQVTITRGDEEQPFVTADNLTDIYSDTLEGTENGTKYTIVATDVSGNTNTCVVTVYEDHLFTHYVRNADGLTMTADCDHACGATDTAATRWGSVEWQYAYSYSVSDDANNQSGVQNVGERQTYAVAELHQILGDVDTVIATKIVNCEDTCGTSQDITSATKDYCFETYEVDGEEKYIPLVDENGRSYTYTVEISPIRMTGNGTYEKIRDYAVDYSEQYVGEGAYGLKGIIRYQPGCFNLPWTVSIEGQPVFEGMAVVPDYIYVKVLYGEHENATDGDYQVITQHNKPGDMGVKCVKVANGDGTYRYEGDYPVWKYVSGTTDCYYYRIQVVKYGYNGVEYDLSTANPPYTSICDSDHSKHTICYVPGAEDSEDGAASGVIEYEITGLTLPVVVFDLNEGNDTTNPASCNHSGIIRKDIIGEAVTEEEINEVAPTRNHYEFLGWFDKATGGNPVTEIESLETSVTLFAHWRETVAPSGTITVNKNHYTDLATAQTFERFEKDRLAVTITGEDAGFANGQDTGVDNSGIKSIGYCVVSSEISDFADVADTLTWTPYGDTFEITEDGAYIIYAKVEDKAGNVTYLATEGIILDTKAPVIAGVDANRTYCEGQTITVTDVHLAKVLVNGTEVEISEDGSFVLIPAATPYEIKTYDEADNVTVLSQIQVNDGHTWTYEGDGTDLVTASCGVSDCELYEASDMTVTMDVTGGDYIALPYEAEVTSSQAFNREGAGTVGAIQYYQVQTAGEKTGGTFIDGAPVHVGNYYAKAEITTPDGNTVSVVKAFSVKAVSLTELTIRPEVLDYTGELVGPEDIKVYALVNGQTKLLTKDSDYTITENEEDKKVTKATRAGIYTVEVTGTGDYTGTLSAEYEILDSDKPVITGIENGKSYCEDKEISVTDDNLTTVKITDESGAVIKEAGDLTDTFTYTLKGTDAGTTYTIVATDASGNHNDTMKVTVYKDHSFTDYKVAEDRHSKTADCDHNCGATHTITLVPPVGSISVYGGQTPSVPDVYEGLRGGQTPWAVHPVNADLSVTIATRGVADGEDTEDTGVAGISYLLSDTYLEDVKQADEDGNLTWTSYKDNIKIAEDGTYILYARIHDTVGNVEYIDTEVYVLDKANPVITGVKADSIYCESRTITVTDAHLAKVVVNGKEVELGEDGSYALTPSATPYEIVAYDEAGNETKVSSVQINDGHTWKTPVFDWKDDLSAATATFVCEVDEGHVEVVDCTIASELTKPATGTQKGEITYTATAVMDEIPYTDTKVRETSKTDELVIDRGTLSTEINVDESVPKVTVQGFDTDAIKDMLTEEEKEQVKNGADILYHVDLTSAGDDMDADRQTILDEKIGELAQQYADGDEEVLSLQQVVTKSESFDISIFKRIGDGDDIWIANTNGRNFTVNMEIPKSLQSDSDTVTYQVIRVYVNEDGQCEAEIIPVKEQDGILSFETDCSGIYTIVSVDKDLTLGTPVISVSLDKEKVTLDKKGAYIRLVATVTPEEAVNKEVVWTSSNPKVARVSQKGKVTALREGTTTITVTTVDGEKKAKCKVTVYFPTKEKQKENNLKINKDIKVSQIGDKIKVIWGKVKDADGYMVYAQYCATRFEKTPTKKVNTPEVTKVEIKKLHGKKLDLKKNYKLYVVAYKNINGEKVEIGRTITIHIVGRKNNKETNVNGIKLEKSSFTLKKGKKAQIKAKTTLVDPKKKPLSDWHAKELRYATSDASIATVSEKGVVTAKKKGTCVIYVYARNGYTKQVKIRVK